MPSLAAAPRSPARWLEALPPAPRPVLIVDGDAALRAYLAERFARQAGFAPDQAGSAAEAEAKLAAAVGVRHGAVLLAVRLPDGDGRELCARLRRRGLKVPILLLAGTGAERDVVRGLEAGADDVVAKPVRLGELLARVRAQLRARFRAFDASESAAFAVGPFLFRPAARLLTDATGDHKVWLAGKESAVLRVLCRAGGEAVPRPALLDAVWGSGRGASAAVLGVYIHKLRRKIEPDPPRPRLLLAVEGGYRLAPG